MRLQPADLLITDALYRRVPSARYDLRAEATAFHELSSVLIKDPEAAVQRFLELALRLCGAGSAGLSTLAQDENGEPVFRWDALAGAFSPYVGGTTPRDFSPCGLCLDAGTTILLDRPARVFTYFDRAESPITEGLVVPLFDTGRVPLGTLWVASHDEHRFDANHARIMEHLAVQLVLALKLAGERRDRSAVIEALKAQVVEKDAIVQEVHHRVKNTIQSTTALLRLQARTARSDEAKAALDEAQQRLSVFASVHELLYRGAADLQQVGIADLLQGVVEGLRRTFAGDAGQVAVRVDADELLLSPDQAVPLALVANEAVTNAYKHAFPGGRLGAIALTLRRRDDGTLFFMVEDDGVGMKRGRRDGFGLRLVRSFARQLNAEARFETKAGTRLTLILPADEGRPRQGAPRVDGPPADEPPAVHGEELLPG
ncbi:MAG TPA: histidine kinase dimerization/phosphoacceptor domain -containing protein [Beijerinckiaceae bacterium]|nr:histidine kinase dimerization/phosphoacceptor domain -containing protein [Beijerinckiaceae bacterium]